MTWVVMFGIGLFLLLYPRSPVAIAFLRSYGPRTDLRGLLPDELSRNGSAWLSLALAAALAGFLAILAGELAGLETRYERLAFLLPAAIAFGLAGWFLLGAVSSYARAVFQRPERTTALLRARVPGVELPAVQDLDDIRRALANRGTPIPDPPPQPGIDPAEFTRAVSGFWFTAAGTLAGAGALALAIHALRSATPVAGPWGFVAFLALAGAAAIALGRWIDRVAKAPRPRPGQDQPKRPVT